MDPRRAKAAASGAPALDPLAGVERLPDDLLIKVLGHLSGEERRAAALVSQRWHSCAFAPVFCREFHLVARSQQCEQLESFCDWLSRHGQHLRRLQISIFPGAVGQGADEDAIDAIYGELNECMWEMAQTAQRLERFVLAWHLSSPLAVAAGLSLPPSLRELGLLSRCKLGFEGGLDFLTQLTQLQLLSRKALMSFRDCVSLPPSVRMLAFGEEGAGALPSQLSALTGLDSLVLQGSWEAPGLALCPAFTRLSALEFHCVGALPPCLGDMTGLQRLAVDMGPNPDEEGLDAALRRLTGLTSLFLWQALCGGAAAGALAGLTRLQQFYFWHSEDVDPLPSGPWSSSLRAVGARIECLEGSVPLMAACTALQEVVVLSAAADYATGPFWEWARQHAPLRRLQLDGWAYRRDAPPSPLVEAVAALAQARPSLEARWTDSRAEDFDGYTDLFVSRFLWPHSFYEFGH